MNAIDLALTDSARPSFSWRFAIVRIAAVAAPLLVILAAVHAL